MSEKSLLENKLPINYDYVPIVTKFWGSQLHCSGMDNGTTPLFVAAQEGHAGVVQQLCDAKVFEI